NLPGYWDKKAGGDRWQYYRLNSLSHNVPLIDGKGQDPNGKSAIARTASSIDGAFTIIDLSKAYQGVTDLMRGVSLFGNRKAVLVQDEFSLVTPLPVAWGMTTD